MLVEAGLVAEYKVLRVEIWPALEPVLPMRQDVGTARSVPTARALRDRLRRESGTPASRSEGTKQIPGGVEPLGSTFDEIFAPPERLQVCVVAAVEKVVEITRSS